MRTRGLTNRSVATVAALALVAAATLAACSSGSGDAADSTTVPPPPARLTAVTPDVAATPSAGCSGAKPTAPGVSEGHVASGGVDRVYQLDIPPSYDGTKPFAIVLGLHSLTVDYRFVATLNGFNDVIGKYDFIGVMPSGLLDGKTPYWYAAPTADNYDVTFIADLLDQLEATLCVDTARVFSTGMSNGAQMSSLLACRMSDRIAGIAPVSGVEYLEPCDGQPVAVVAFHGSVDPILPYTGGGLNATKIADIDYWKGKIPAGMPAPLGIDESMRRWAEHNGCDPEPVETHVSPSVRKRTWQNCAAATELYVVDGGGHSWPGKPQPAFEKTFGPGTTEIDATTLIWAFFFGRPAG